MMAERNVAVTHTTIMRWVHRFVPEFERRWARFAKPLHCSWRMDETAVSVRGRGHYLYRAVDRNGKSVHSLLCKDRTICSAQDFFRQATQMPATGWPEKINLDGNIASHRALQRLANEDTRWQRVKISARRYLNNIVEQDHRAIKRRCAPMLGLKSFRTAAITLSGIELAHRIRKRDMATGCHRPAVVSPGG
jgi:transposase-like protein